MIRLITILLASFTIYPAICIAIIVSVILFVSIYKFQVGAKFLIKNAQNSITYSWFYWFRKTRKNSKWLQIFSKEIHTPLILICRLMNSRNLFPRIRNGNFQRIDCNIGYEMDRIFYFSILWICFVVLKKGKEFG